MGIAADPPAGMDGAKLCRLSETELASVLKLRPLEAKGLKHDLGEKAAQPARAPNEA